MLSACAPREEVASRRPGIFKFNKYGVLVGLSSHRQRACGACPERCPAAYALTRIMSDATGCVLDMIPDGVAPSHLRDRMAMTFSLALAFEVS